VKVLIADDDRVLTLLLATRLKAKAVAFLRKPIDPEAMHTTLSQLVGQAA